MLKLYDSLTRKTKPFPPEEGRPVTIYACGPTVYHHAHIGNLRTFLTVDLLRRFLEHRGRTVELVMNITDVGHMLDDAERGEDKMEAAAAREGKTQEEVARFYEAAFFRDMDALGFRRALHPRATEHLPEMIELVKDLLDKGLAYATDKGGIYFDVRKFKGYGKLSGNSVEDLVAGARVEVAEDKRHPADFALWIDNPAHRMQWEFAWDGRAFRGYPGWHLECSAMAKKHLGATIDLHAGGEDLKFPHHESEIAQSEGANGAAFARHWLHVTYLVVDGEKMSKSKGNFYTLSDLLEKGFSAAAVRWLLLSAHYRTQLNFTLEGLEAAERSVRYFRDLHGRLREAADAPPADDAAIRQRLREAETAFTEALADDLNVSAALAAVYGPAGRLQEALQEGRLSGETARLAMDFLEGTLGAVFGIDLAAPAEEIPEGVRSLAEERQAARSRQEWEESDRLREALAEKGWSVDDVPGGYRLKKS